MMKTKKNDWLKGIKQNYFSENPDEWAFCGICSVYFVLQCLGIKMKPETVFKELHKGHNRSEIQNGITLGAMRKVFKKLNVRNRYRLFTKEERRLFMNFLEVTASVESPVIVLPFMHAISVLGVVGNDVFYVEPNNPSEIITRNSKINFSKYCFDTQGFTEVLYFK